MSRILITGGAGFIGFSLARRLSRDPANSIVIVDNLTRGEIDSELQEFLKKDNIQFQKGDLTKQDFFFGLDNNFDYVYHLAGIVGVKNVVDNPDKVLYVNAVATLNIFDYLKKARNLKRVFFSSTSEVYSGTLNYMDIPVPTNEIVPLIVADIKKPRTTYALSKIYGEAIGFIFGAKYSIPVTIGRFHNVYGPRMGFSHVIPELFVKIANNDVVELFSPSHTRAFCFVEDAVEMMIKLSENKNSIGEVFHIGNCKEEIKMKQLAELIAKVCGRSVVINNGPNTPGSPARRCPDTTKIRKLTGFEPQVSLEDGLGITYEWYKNKLNK